MAGRRETGAPVIAVTKGKTLQWRERDLGWRWPKNPGGRQEHDKKDNNRGLCSGPRGEVASMGGTCTWGDGAIEEEVPSMQSKPASKQARSLSPKDGYLYIHLYSMGMYWMYCNLLRTSDRERQQQQQGMKKAISNRQKTKRQ